MTSVLRAGFAVPAAVAVTIFLLWVMQFLIATGIPALQESMHAVPIEFVRLQRDEAVQLKERKPPDRPDEIETPPPPPSAVESSNAPGGSAVGVYVPSFNKEISLSRDALAAPSDADAIPLVRVPPMYPAVAEVRGLEGWVELEFTISETGGVEDVHVVASDPPSIFDRAATQALLRWRYKPRIENGRPVKRYNNRVVISFDLENVGPRGSS